MRLLAGVLASAPFRAELVGDASLSSRPMERVAEPLRRMGARVRTTDGHAPVAIEGGRLRGTDHTNRRPSSQVKGAVLLAGLAAEGDTAVREPIPTRDHTERALRALGAPVATEGDTVRLAAFQHDGFEGRVPGDPSSAAFLVAAAALTGSELTITGVGLNPTRLRFLDVLARMGVRTERRPRTEEVGEPLGELWVAGCDGLVPTEVPSDEVPLVIDEIPLLALVAAHARGDSRFVATDELRVKESDRLAGTAEGIRSLGGRAAVEGDDLVIAGGGLAGGAADSRRDHRMAMAFAVGALAATGPCEVGGIEWADVSFPGFVPTLSALGARAELLP
jgi:3-phosphoshikimate 1-carboxyvinyltransferase